MAKKKCPDCKKGTPLWMVSWADMVTLLLCFFIIIVAFSSTSATKFKDMAGSMKDAFGVQKREVINPILSGQNLVGLEFQQEVQMVQLIEKLQMLAERQVDGDEVDLVVREDGFAVQVNTDELQDQSGAIRPKLATLLEEIGRLLASSPNQIQVRGHSDERPGSAGSASSWAVAALHAALVTDFLATKGGVDPRRLLAMSAGATEPLTTDTTEQARVKNRRVEILVTREIPATMRNELGQTNEPP